MVRDFCTQRNTFGRSERPVKEKRPAGFSDGRRDRSGRLLGQDNLGHRNDERVTHLHALAHDADRGGVATEVLVVLEEGSADLGAAGYLDDAPALLGLLGHAVGSLTLAGGMAPLPSSARRALPAPSPHAKPPKRSAGSGNPWPVPGKSTSPPTATTAAAACAATNRASFPTQAGLRPRARPAAGEAVDFDIGDQFGSPLSLATATCRSIGIFGCGRPQNHDRGGEHDDNSEDHEPVFQRAVLLEIEESR